jgi:hypothetical protein
MTTASLGIGGEGFEIAFTAFAIRHLETITGRPYDAVLRRMALGQASGTDLLNVLWAGLEGARVYRKQLRGPYSLEEVCELTDRGGGLEAFFDPEGPQMPLIRDCFMDAFPVTKRNVDRKLAELAEKKKREEAAAGAAEPLRPTSETGASTGRPVSNGPPTRTLRKRSSGASPSVS